MMYGCCHRGSWLYSGAEHYCGTVVTATSITSSTHTPNIRSQHVRQQQLLQQGHLSNTTVYNISTNTTLTHLPSVQHCKALRFNTTYTLGPSAERRAARSGAWLTTCGTRRGAGCRWAR